MCKPGLIDQQSTQCLTVATNTNVLKWPENVQTGFVISVFEELQFHVSNDTEKTSHLGIFANINQLYQYNYHKMLFQCKRFCLQNTPHKK